MRTARRCSVAAVAAALLVNAGPVACSSSDDTSSRNGVPDGVALSFTQLRYDEGTTTGRLRVVNESDRAFDVSAIGLDWSGYGRFTVDYSTTVEAGRILDLPMTVPEPTCPRPPDPPGDPVIGVVVTDAGVVESELDESGTGFVHRQWRRICNDRRVRDGVDLAYGEPFRLRGSGGTARLEGTLMMRRAPGEELPVRVVEARGSVLFRVTLTGPARLAEDEVVLRVPIRIRSFRCDDHALGESSQTFYFSYVVRFGDEEPIAVIRVPGPGIRRLAQRLVALTCG